MIFGKEYLSAMSRYITLAIALAFAARLSAGTTLTFEGFADSTILTNQYPGVTFTNTIVLTAGISLNEFEFPPHSGTNVVSDNGGPITVSFATPINSFSAYFTYAEPLTLKAFSSTDIALATTSSLYSNDEALSGIVGSSPNELETLTSLSGIFSVTITGDPLGGSFTMDDLTYSTTKSSTTPEPSGLPLTLAVLIFVIGYQARKSNTPAYQALRGVVATSKRKPPFPAVTFDVVTKANSCSGLRTFVLDCHTQVPGQKSDGEWRVTLNFLTRLILQLLRRSLR